ncbi:hypothetical protein Tco_0349394 [Tanacetum coccineum]
MAVLESCPKHNMVAYLEKTDGNAEFHEIIDFLARSSIHNALTVSPVVSTTFVEQFWMSAKSKIINNVRYITAKVAGKPVSISEASIRSDLLFDDADGIDSLPNQAIFDAIQLMGYEGDLTSDPSPRPSPTTHIPDSIPESSNGNHRGQSSSDKSLSGNEGDMTLQSVYDLCISLCTQVTDQAKEIKHLKAQIKKLKKKAKPVITHHRAWMKSVSMKQRLAGKKSLKTQWMQKEFLTDDMLDYVDTKNAQDSGRTRNVVFEEEESPEDAVSTEDVVSTDKEKVSTDRSKVSTDRSRVSTDKDEVSTDRSKVSTDRSRVSTDKDEDKEKLKEKEKGVELKDVEETKRPRPTSTRSLLTLKPLLKIDLKDKGKKKIEKEDESDTESEAEEEVKKLAEEEAIKAALSNEYDFIQATIEAYRLLALRLQDEEREREQFTVEERAKFLHDTIAAQRRFFAEERAIAIRNRPPTRTQLRSQMMTYLKYVGNKKHSDLKNKTFEEIQALYEKVKRFDKSFTVVSSTKDERKIKEMNEGAKDLEQKRLKNKVAKETPKKEDTTKVLAKVDVTEQGIKKIKCGHMKMLARKRKRPQSNVDSDDEHRKCLKIITFEDGDYLVIYRANKNFMAFNYLLEGDLKIMMESSKEENDQSDFWNNQQNWEIITWRLYEACGLYILELEDGTVIHMLVERMYPLLKDLMQKMLDFGLEVEIESTVALDLIRFIKQQLNEE